MLSSKVIDILKSFSDEEFKKFPVFLNSPFHNKNKKAVQLFNILSPFHPTYDDKDLSKEFLYSKLFKEKNSTVEYNDASVRNLLSDLLILSEKYLAFINFENDKFSFNESLLKALSERKLQGAFERKVKSVEDTILTAEFSGEDDYFKKYLIEELKSANSQFSDDLKLYKTNYLINASDYLTYYYLLRIFKMVNFFEWQKQYNTDNPLTIAESIVRGINIEELIDKVKYKSAKDQMILTVYYYMYLALKNPDNEEMYFEFKKFLTKHCRLFSLLEQYGLYICLTNSCVQKIDLGKTYFNNECFSVYRIMLNKKLFESYPGYFSMTTFTAIVNTGISSGNYTEVEKFINEYSIKLHPVHRKDSENYALALLNFSRENYIKALEYVSLTETEFTNFKYHLKIIMLKSFYELSDYESLYYTADSFSHFLNKNKVVGKNYRKEFNSFIKALDLLVKYKSGKETKHFDRLCLFLKERSFTGKSWIKEKLEKS